MISFFDRLYLSVRPSNPLRCDAVAGLAEARVNERPRRFHVLDPSLGSLETVDISDEGVDGFWCVKRKMTELNARREDLVVANRFLAYEGVVDGFGHVSLRQPERPDRFLCPARAVPSS